MSSTWSESSHSAAVCWKVCLCNYSANISSLGMNVVVVEKRLIAICSYLKSIPWMGNTNGGIFLVQTTTRGGQDDNLQERVSRFILYYLRKLLTSTYAHKQLERWTWNSGLTRVQVSSHSVVVVVCSKSSPPIPMVNPWRCCGCMRMIAVCGWCVVLPEHNLSL